MKQVLTSNIYEGFPGNEVEYHKKIEIFADSLSGFDANKDTFKIMYLNEVVGIDQMKRFIIDNNHMFDAIITHHPDILEQCSNSYLLPRGTAWVFDYKFTKKKFQVSNLAGKKTFCEGHRLRQKVHYKQNRIKIPKDFYVGKFGGVELFDGNKILTGKKDPMYDSQFNIAIENVKQENWFTEKLIDCFVTKTVPIYWGCPNIDNWFDTRGIIMVDSFSEIIDVCNSLTKETYSNMLPYVELNFEKCQEFIRVNERMGQLIENIIKGEIQD